MSGPTHAVLVTPRTGTPQEIAGVALLGYREVDFIDYTPGYIFHFLECNSVEMKRQSLDLC